MPRVKTIAPAIELPAHAKGEAAAPAIELPKVIWYTNPISQENQDPTH